MDHAGMRLRDRSAASLSLGSRTRVVFLAAVAAVVVITTLAQVLAGYFLAVSDIPRYRALLIVSSVLGSVINMILLLLVWMLFDTVRRVEMESDRLQTFMDNVYRRGTR